MTYQLIIPADIRRQILDLPAADQAEVSDLLDRLEADPEEAAGVYGQDVPHSVQMRTAGLSRLIITVLVDEDAHRVTVVRVSDPFAG